MATQNKAFIVARYNVIQIDYLIFSVLFLSPEYLTNKAFQKDKKVK